MILLGSILELWMVFQLSSTVKVFLPWDFGELQSLADHGASNNGCNHILHNPISHLQIPQERLQGWIEASPNSRTGHGKQNTNITSWNLKLCGQNDLWILPTLTVYVEDLSNNFLVPLFSTTTLLYEMSKLLTWQFIEFENLLFEKNHGSTVNHFP